MSECRRPRRPWKVFVFDIGPTYSFAHEHAARARAELLVASEYGKIAVYTTTGDLMRRTLYRFNQEPVIQEFSKKGWTPVSSSDMMISSQGHDRRDTTDED